MRKAPAGGVVGCRTVLQSEGGPFVRPLCGAEDIDTLPLLRAPELACTFKTGRAIAVVTSVLSQKMIRI